MSRQFKPKIVDVRGEARARRLASHAEHQRDVIGRLQAGRAAYRAAAATGPKIVLKPVDFSQPGNELRPASLDQMVGQATLKPLLRRLIDNARQPGRRLPHLLMVGASGTGKTTVSLVVARELGARCFSLKAPLDMGTLDALRTQAQDGDVVFVDEIHMQVSGDRRGITQACDPESFYMLLEDGVLSLPAGPQPFPKVTWIGATTDVGLLPEPLTNRFPLQPALEEYTEADMARLVLANAHALGLSTHHGATVIFAKACRRNPRQLNSYLRSAEALTTSNQIGGDLATEVVTSLAGTTLDGLTPSMQMVLRYLYRSCKRTYKATGDVTYTCSVNQLASACGHGRDTKAISLLVEPWLIKAGLLGVQHMGRVLTEAGITRAKELS